MCYKTLLSTTSALDLAAFNTTLLRMSRDVPNLLETELLQHPQRWFVGSQYGCSCGFRHLTAFERGFAAPESWWPEDDCDIEATLQLVAMLRTLVAEGAQVDCMDVWTEDEPVSTGVLEGDMVVDLSTVPDTHFWLFCQHRFALI